VQIHIGGAGAWGSWLPRAPMKEVMSFRRCATTRASNTGRRPVVESRGAGGPNLERLTVITSERLRTRRMRYVGQRDARGAEELAERRELRFVPAALCAPLPLRCSRTAQARCQPDQASATWSAAWLCVFISGAPFRGGSVASGPSNPRGATGVGAQERSAELASLSQGTVADRFAYDRRHITRV
jgi:hypothetical protein